MENSDKQHVAAVQNIYKKIAAARKNPLSEHNMAMSKLEQLDKKRPAETPVPSVVLDSKGRVVG